MVEAENGKMSEQVERIFEYWKLVMNHPRAQLDTKRGVAIRRILKAGYSEEDCNLAIEGCADSSFHQGDNEDGKIYDSIGLIFRDADHLDRFIENGTKLRLKVKKHLEAATRPAAEKPSEPRKAMPESARARIRELLKVELSKPKEN